jgi:hypothetical protein
MVSAVADRLPLEEFHELYLQARGRRPKPATIEAIEDLLPWLGRCARSVGPNIRVTLAEIVRGLGWPAVGNSQATRSTYWHPVMRRLAMLRDIGWVESYGELPRAANGEGVGILIVLSPAGVAQSVGATPYDLPSSPHGERS